MSTHLAVGKFALALICFLCTQCVVDEALLTGESVPQLKESCDVLEPATLLSLNDHKVSHYHMIDSRVTLCEVMMVNFAQ